MHCTDNALCASTLAVSTPVLPKFKVVELTIQLLVTVAVAVKLVLLLRDPVGQEGPAFVL